MFCRHCGKELCAQAYVCPACGALVRALPVVQTEPTAPQRREKLERLSRTFSKIAAVFNGIAFGFLLLLIGSTIICFTATNNDQAINGFFLFLCAWVYGVLTAAAAAELATAGFVLGLIQKHNEEVKKFSIIIFVVSLVLLVTNTFGWFMFAALS